MSHIVSNINQTRNSVSFVNFLKRKSKNLYAFRISDPRLNFVASFNRVCLCLRNFWWQMPNSNCQIQHLSWWHIRDNSMKFSEQLIFVICPLENLMYWDSDSTRSIVHMVIESTQLEMSMFGIGIPAGVSVCVQHPSGEGFFRWAR